MTKRQREIFEWIKEFARENGVPPTIIELGKRFGISKVTAWEHMNALQRLGLLHYEPHKSRSAMPAERCPTCGSLLRCCAPTGE